ncbi:MAG: hypothetical protein ACYCWE_16255 [Eubacteriales bacterium]
MKKSLAWILLLALIVTTAACAAAADDSGIVTTVPESTEETAEESEDYSAYYPDEDYEGYAFRILTPPNNGWSLNQLNSEELDGEVLNDAIYMRNRRIEELLNVKISIVENSNIVSTVSKAVSGGADDFDMLYGYLYELSSLSQKSFLYNLLNVPVFNFDMPWWDKASVDLLEINGKLFFAENEINIQYDEATWVLFFNKTIVSDYSLASPYELVRDNKWTMDKMYEMMLAVTSDANGDGTMSAPEDMFGFATHSASYVALLAGGNEKLIAKNTDGTFTVGMENERFGIVTEIVNKIIGAKEATVLPDKFKGARTNDNEWARNTFWVGRSLFYGEVIGTFNDLRNVDEDFGLLPFPKYESLQEYYTCYILNSAMALGMPFTSLDAERTGNIIEALAVDSHTSVLPAYYDVTITGKSLRDEESAEMLDIIFTYRQYDLGVIFQWGGIDSLYIKLVDKFDTYASLVESNKEKIETAIAKTMTAYEEME